jgi:hypothetical protein
MHAEILAEASVMLHVDHESLVRFVDKPLTSGSVLLWVFRVEGSGTVSCLVGTPEKRQVFKKVGKEAVVSEVTEIKYAPFSGNFHFETAFATQSGTAASGVFAERFRQAGVTANALLEGAEPWDPLADPTWTSKDAWSREGEAIALGSRDHTAGGVIPGSIRKDVKVSATMKQRATLVAVGTAQFGAGDSVVHFLSVNGQVWASAPPPFEVDANSASAAAALQNRVHVYTVAAVALAALQGFLVVRLAGAVQDKALHAAAGGFLVLLATGASLAGLLALLHERKKANSAWRSSQLNSGEAASEQLKEALSRLDGLYGGEPSTREQALARGGTDRPGSAGSYSLAVKARREAQRRFAAEMNPLSRREREVELYRAEQLEEQLEPKSYMIAKAVVLGLAWLIWFVVYASLLTTPR